uniref:RNA helicase n=1 Tax=Caenorhabditis japonica TaxID=281687 RepID=A0A8R1DVK3_CAEJA
MQRQYPEHHDNGGYRHGNSYGNGRRSFESGFNHGHVQYNQQNGSSSSGFPQNRYRHQSDTRSNYSSGRNGYERESNYLSDEDDEPHRRGGYRDRENYARHEDGPMNYRNDSYSPNWKSPSKTFGNRQGNDNFHRNDDYVDRNQPKGRYLGNGPHGNGYMSRPNENFYPDRPGNFRNFNDGNFKRNNPPFNGGGYRMGYDDNLTRQGNNPYDGNRKEAPNNGPRRQYQNEYPPRRQDERSDYNGERGLMNNFGGNDNRNYRPVRDVESMCSSEFSRDGNSSAQANINHGKKEDEAQNSEAKNQEEHPPSATIRKPPRVKAPPTWHPTDRVCEEIARENSRQASYLKTADDQRVKATNAEVKDVKTWEEMGLDASIIGNCNMNGYVFPREVQKKMIPLILEGHDLIAKAETGGGKTAGYLIPIIHQIMSLPDEEREVARGFPIVLALILVPTRELCTQVFEHARSLAKDTGIEVVHTHGELDRHVTMERLNRGCAILVGTCGRILDHINREQLCFGSLKFVVLDEVDNMFFATGHLQPLWEHEQLWKNKKKPQIIASSATITAEVETSVVSKMEKPQGCADVVRVEPVTDRLNKRIKPTFVKVEGYEEKIENLLEILSNKMKIRESASQIIFVNKKKRCPQIAELLKSKGYNCALLTGDVPQNERDEVLKAFKDGSVEILVSTDLCARGLDVVQLDRIIMLDLPFGTTEQVQSTYLHRIGRVGRVYVGYAYTLVDTTVAQNGESAIAIAGLVHAKNGILIPEWFSDFADEAREKLLAKSEAKEKIIKGPNEPPAVSNDVDYPKSPVKNDADENLQEVMLSN